MQRYFVESSNWVDDQVTLSAGDTHHITRVMRMGIGDEIVCIHPDLGAATCKISSVSDEEVQCHVTNWLKENRELAVHVTIAQSLGKGDKLEWVVQKGTELGAESFIPYQADRSVSKWDQKKAPKKIQRLNKIAKEASEQSERLYVPDVKALAFLKNITHLTNSYDHCFLAYENEARSTRSVPLASHLKKVEPGNSVLIIFGPEGGFSDNEADELMRSGFVPVRLGSRILRMETAPLYFLSSLSYQLEEQEG